MLRGLTILGRSTGVTTGVKFFFLEKKGTGPEDYQAWVDRNLSEVPRTLRSNRANIAGRSGFCIGAARAAPDRPGPKTGWPKEVS